MMREGNGDEVAVAAGVPHAVERCFCARRGEGPMVMVKEEGEWVVGAWMQRQKQKGRAPLLPQ